MKTPPAHSAPCLILRGLCPRDECVVIDNLLTINQHLKSLLNRALSFSLLAQLRLALCPPRQKHISLFFFNGQIFGAGVGWGGRGAVCFTDWKWQVWHQFWGMGCAEGVCANPGDLKWDLMLWPLANFVTWQFFFNLFKAPSNPRNRIPAPPSSLQKIFNSMVCRKVSRFWPYVICCNLLSRYFFQTPFCAQIRIQSTNGEQT